MENHLKNQLDLALSPSHCEVLNESSQHSGPATESHFKIVVVSSYFDEMKLHYTLIKHCPAIVAKD